jgi:hypothetical protein
LPSRDGKQVFAVGSQTRGELIRYDSVSVSGEDRQHEVAFAQDCVAKHDKYGYLTICCLGVGWALEIGARNLLWISWASIGTNRRDF